MQALVHFTVGVVGALLVLSVVDRPPREEFLAMFASGFWAMVPDFHWLLREVGINAGADVWRAVHGTWVANLFWFHHLIDSLETGEEILEAAFALVLLVVAVGVYYLANDWGVE